ncbi:MAG: ATP-dependent DNA helicase [Butyrivibrio sp.]|nr:ATP-dependent DNA helicase [Butyrivibrio sp.]
MKEIKISVRALVEFLLREGNIDNRVHTGSENAMLEGSRIHRLIQKRMGAEYEAEVPLKFNYDTSNYRLVIEGRADGIVRKGLSAENSEIYRDNSILYLDDADLIEFDDVSLIDEIKGTYRDLNKMRSPVATHLAQAKCYAYIFALQNNLQAIRVRMTYCNLDTEEIRYFNYNYHFEEIAVWFNSLLKGYLKWADFQYEWEKIRTTSIKQLQFPFSYRTGQKELAGHVYRTIVHKRKLFLEAPTGTGKTITTIFPSVKAIGEGKADKIFYLTAKTITRTVAENAYNTLRENGALRFKTCTITARDKICFLDESNCNPVACPYAKGHFDRINNAIFDLMENEDDFSREKISEYAMKHEVCPFEMSLDMSLFADGIICDYNYVYDPYVYLRRFFAEGDKKPYIFLVDESHNLLDRGREMYSADLFQEEFEIFAATIRDAHPRIAGLVDKCDKELQVLRDDCNECSILDSVDEFVKTLNRLSTVISEYLENNNEGINRDEILQFYFRISRFLVTFDRLDELYTVYSEIQEDNTFKLKLFCVDPSKNLLECMNRAVSTILFSATLLPIQYYKKLLGGIDEDYEVYANSVFDPSQCEIFIGTDVTSKYSRRSEKEFRNIASYINSIVEAKPGNYLVFFPSHVFLEQVLDIYMDEYHNPEMEKLLIQGEYMSEEDRESFISNFDVSDQSNSIDFSKVIKMEIDIEENKNILGFCVMGGIFSEGIDLKKDSLIGVIVVGTGIPQVCNEREILFNYFESKGKDGFDYAYRYPGMNKVLQAAGRVIRTEEDRGVVALLDERFTSYSYKGLFPREWKQILNVSTDTVKNAVEAFWNKG